MSEGQKDGRSLPFVSRHEGMKQEECSCHPSPPEKRWGDEWQHKARTAPAVRHVSGDSLGQTDGARNTLSAPQDRFAAGLRAFCASADPRQASPGLYPHTSVNPGLDRGVSTNRPRHSHAVEDFPAQLKPSPGLRGMRFMLKSFSSGVPASLHKPLQSEKLSRATIVDSVKSRLHTSGCMQHYARESDPSFPDEQLVSSHEPEGIVEDGGLNPCEVGSCAGCLDTQVTHAGDGGGDASLAGEVAACRDIPRTSSHELRSNEGVEAGEACQSKAATELRFTRSPPTLLRLGAEKGAETTSAILRGARPGTGTGSARVTGSLKRTHTSAIEAEDGSGNTLRLVQLRRKTKQLTRIGFYRPRSLLESVQPPNRMLEFNRVSQVDIPEGFSRDTALQSDFTGPPPCGAADSSAGAEWRDRCHEEDVAGKEQPLSVGLTAAALSSVDRRFRLRPSEVPSSHAKRGVGDTGSHSLPVSDNSDEQPIHSAHAVSLRTDASPEGKLDELPLQGKIGNDGSVEKDRGCHVAPGGKLSVSPFNDFKNQTNENAVEVTSECDCRSARRKEGGALAEDFRRVAAESAGTACLSCHSRRGRCR